ncbi:ABC transporter ATP-binding protein [bacterium]|nr:ABC transporter ATP-binding protein [bacterium]
MQNYQTSNNSQSIGAIQPVVLEVQNLSVNFRVYGGQVYAVRDVSFNVRAGECLCIVGESGSGKSVTVQSMMGLSSGKITAGKAFLNGQELIAMSNRERRNVLGKEIAMIFQDPLASLNPTMTIGDQIEESLKLHTTLNRAQRKERVVELLELVRIPEPRRRVEQFPHELSGGMRQRVMIAMALACNPKVLIADEPTTALDVTIQAQILTLIQELARKFNMATILITHDLGVVAQMADRVAVMYAGKIVEEGPVDDVFYASKHPYTVGLKRAMPKDTGSVSDPLQPIPGTPPDLFAPPPGCAFAARCSAAMSICHRKQPPEQKNGALRASCWLHHENATQYLKSSGVSPFKAPAQEGHPS